MSERKGADGKFLLSEERFLDIQTEVREQVRKAMDFAESSPIPDVQTELYSDVLLNPMKNMSPIADYIHGAKNPLL
jgi:TPP-dependent pyruvate/acetoin dehydrogenase alpha subunit